MALSRARKGGERSRGLQASPVDLANRGALPFSITADHIDHHDQLSELGMAESTWTVAEAKARLSEVIAQAQAEGPQTITRRGHAAAVIVSADEWERKTRRVGTLADFFAASPLRGSGLEVSRPKDGPRKVEL